MDLTTLIFIGLFIWMISMHLRPGGHGGHGMHGSHGTDKRSAGQHRGHA